MENFKISLKAARINKNMTAEDAANKIGKNKRTILNWENSITPITADNFYKLCEIYEINPDYVGVAIVENNKENFF